MSHSILRQEATREYQTACHILSSVRKRRGNIKQHVTFYPPSGVTNFLVCEHTKFGKSFLIAALKQGLVDFMFCLDNYSRPKNSSYKMCNELYYTRCYADHVAKYTENIQNTL